MFVHGAEHKNLIIFKHLELLIINRLTRATWARLQEKYVIGYYFGGNYAGEIEHLPHFYICISGLNEHLQLSLDCVPRFHLSGFNFLPDEVFSKSVAPGTNFVYIGDSSPRKELLGALRFSRQFPEIPLRCILKMNGYWDRIFLTAIGWVLGVQGRRNVTLVVPKEGRSHARGSVLAELSSARACLMPYRNEGAARVFAEAEALGIPVVFNRAMKGGTLNFSVPCENLAMDEFSTKSFESLNKKDRHKKRLVYSECFSSKSFEQFLKHNFSMRICFEEGQLVNAFSGHRNVIDERFTNSGTDEVLSVKALVLFIKEMADFDAEVSHRSNRLFTRTRSYLKATVIKFIYRIKLLHESKKIRHSG